jgi:hypothetical protein
VAFALGVGIGAALFVAVRPSLGLSGVVGSALDVPIAVEPLQLVLLFAFVVLVAGVGIAIGALVEQRPQLPSIIRRGVE